MKKRNRRLLAVLCAVVTAAGIAAPAMTPVYAAQNEVTNEEVNAEVMSAGNTKDDVDDSGKADEQEDVYSLKYITVDGRTAWYYANEKGEVDKDYIGVIMTMAGGTSKTEKLISPIPDLALMMQAAGESWMEPWILAVPVW